MGVRGSNRQKFCFALRKSLYAPLDESRFLPGRFLFTADTERIGRISKLYSTSIKLKNSKGEIEPLGDSVTERDATDSTKAKPPGSESSLKKSEDKSVILRKAIPRNFIRETFLPHLEHNVAYNSKKFPPDVILQIGIAYSELPAFIRQRTIENALVEAFRYRMVDYTASDCVQLLNTCLRLQGLRTLGIFKDVLTRLQSRNVYGTITTLNRLGICRAISRILNRANSLKNPTDSDKNSKIPDEMEIIDVDAYSTSILRPWTFLTSSIRCSRLSKFAENLVEFGASRILPQLEFELEKFDSDELCDLLAVLAERAERDFARLDYPVVAVLMRHIVALYRKTPLTNSLANLCSLCKLRIKHEVFLKMVTEDLKNPLKVNNIFHKHLAKAVWALGRFGVLDEVLPHLLPHIARNIPVFDASSFARLSQLSHSLKCGKSKAELADCATKTAFRLLYNCEAFTPRDLIFYFVGCCYLRLIPEKGEWERYSAIAPDFRQGPKNFGSLVKANWMPHERWITKSQQLASPCDFLVTILASLERLENDFDLCEIQRIISTAKSFEEFKYTLTQFPKSWNNILEEESDSKP